MALCTDPACSICFARYVTCCCEVCLFLVYFCFWVLLLPSLFFRALFFGTIIIIIISWTGKGV